MQAGPEGGEIVCSNFTRVKNCRQDLRVGKLHAAPERWGDCRQDLRVGKLHAAPERWGNCVQQLHEGKELKAGPEGGEIVCMQQLHEGKELQAGALQSEEQENNMRHLRGGEIEGRT